MIRGVLVLLLSISITLGLTGCKDETGLGGNLIEGVISGEEWEYKFAKANYDPFNETFDVEMFGQMETINDPCAVFSINGYIDMVIPNQTGSFNLPFSNPKYSLTFSQAGVGQESFVANSGFVEIITISGRRVGGYIQAYYDDENIVEGSFAFNRCN